jgi:hypothetical protein
MNDDMGSCINVLYSAIINNIHNSLAITFASMSRTLLRFRRLHSGSRRDCLDDNHIRLHSGSRRDCLDDNHIRLHSGSRRDCLDDNHIRLHSGSRRDSLDDNHI